MTDRSLGRGKTLALKLGRAVAFESKLPVHLQIGLDACKPVRDWSVNRKVEPMTSKRSVCLSLAAGLLVFLVALPARGQSPGTACTSPLDPACNHLKCYKIKDKPLVGTAANPALLQVDNQFGR